ncbi:MAG: YqgE/AlgH family protein [Actinomycetota bacterium]|nr:YqgE/AlgH family protein [Actinomycetota bacterium]
MAPSLIGRLVVATPVMQDPNFDHTVVLVLEHGTEGALGVVLNRPTDADVFSALPRWESLAAEPTVIFVGGPVAPTAAICLARSGEPANFSTVGQELDGGWKPLFGGLGTVDLERDPDDLSAPVEKVRVFAGYTGWGPGQLDDEIDEGAWFVLDALPGDALSAEPATLWEAVLRRQGGPIALVANFPSDPSLN